MARTEETLAAPPTIWPDMPYAEQRVRAQQLHEIEAFRLAKLWRVLAKDHERVTQRVVVSCGIEWHGELQDRVFIYSAVEPSIPKGLPVLLLDADHDPLIGAATLPTEPADGDHAGHQRRGDPGSRHVMQQEQVAELADHHGRGTDPSPA